MSFWKQWFLAVRPKTLTASMIPIVVATSLSLAYQKNNVRLELSWFALLSALFIQIGTNLINDALDFKRGVDTAERIGPVRVTQKKFFHIWTVWGVGCLCFLISIFFALPLIEAGGWVILCIGACSLLAGYCYTGGPYPLSDLGMGDVFVVVFFGWVAVIGVLFLQGCSWMSGGLIAGTQVGTLATVLIAINNWRDCETDRVAGKRTLAVRFGCDFVKLEIFLLLVLPFLLGFFWVKEGYWGAGLLPLLSLGLPYSLLKQMKNLKDLSGCNRLLEQAALFHFVFGSLLSVGFLMSFRLR